MQWLPTVGTSSNAPSQPPPLHLFQAPPLSTSPVGTRSAPQQAPSSLLLNPVLLPRPLPPNTPTPRSATNIVGHGVVLHLPGLFEEIEELAAKGVQVGIAAEG